MNWLQKQVQQNPLKLFIQEGKHKYSFLDVAEMVQAYSQAFLRKGIQPQDKILIYLTGDIEEVAIMLTCFEIGAIPSPISRMLTIKEQEAIIAIIQPRLIITNWKERERFDSISYPLLCIEEILISSGNDSVIKNDHENKVDDVCAIILTSGSTGIPKAVQLTYGNFEISCKNWNNFLQFESGDQFLCCLPLHHIGGFAVLCRALIYGFSINLVSIFEAQAVFDAISCHPVTIISLVPTMLKRILEIEGGKEALKTMRHILLGGGPSPKSLLDICIQERLSIVKVYGMTETCSGTFGLKLLEEPQNKFYTGRPFPKTTVLIKNDEIHISGPMVMKGYLGERNTNGTHNSHDLGRLDDDLLFLHIRRKDLIVSGGENINPLEVEECLLSVNGISDAAVVGKADDEWGQKITAYIVLKSTPLEKESLNSELKKLLSPYKIPKDYIQVSHIPRNELGKIKYDKLKAL